jgi:hypothetical protein
MVSDAIRRMPACLADHPRCGAHARTTGNPCQGQAMANGQCRMHGGNNKGGPCAEKHGNYKHGLTTIEAKEERAMWRATLREMRRLTGT